ncbi:MAG TPA: hypothetical protein VF062_23485 [Candidatus Limnocylindrales bacterium]
MADLPPLATAEQLAVRLGYAGGDFPTQAEASRAEALLVEASELIRDEADEEWVDANNELEDVPRRVEKICLAVASRAFMNPEALTQRGIGDSTKSYDRSRREGGEAVYLTEAEKESIRKAAGSSSFTAVTMVSPWSGDSTTESLLGS